MKTSSGERDPVELLAEDFLERKRRGERPTLQEYLDCHPDLADEIRDLFPALLMMENLGESSGATAGPPAGEDGIAPGARLERLGDYRILREIGRGGMGVVYEAEQISLGRHVALKVLPSQHRQDARTGSRFEREAKAAAKLHHTNIVPVFGVGEHDGLRYYAMQFIQGLGLDVILEELRRLQPGAGRPVGVPRMTGGESRAAVGDVSTSGLARSQLTGGFVMAAERGGDAPAAASAATVDHTSVAPGEEAPPARTPADGRIPDMVLLSSSSTMLPGVAAARQAGKRRPTYWQSVARVGLQVAEALEHAHRQGVLHRDVKPSNLLLDNGGIVWVTDFGLAKVEDQPNLTDTGDILGTLRYMPPEAFDGRADRRGDIYSLGLTLYELLAMRPAFDEKERQQLIKRVMTEVPPRLEKLNREVPRDLVTIVHKAIDREPSRRYPTAAAMADDLRRFLADEPIRARRAYAAERLGCWCRRNPVVAVLSVALWAVFVIGFVGIAWKWRDAEWQADLARSARTKEAEQRVIAVKQADRATAEADRSRRLLYGTEMSLARQAWDAGDLGRALALLEKQEPRDGQEDLRHFEWRYLKALCRDGSRLTLRGHTADITAVVFSPDGKTLATAAANRSIRLWDVASRRCVRLSGLPANALAFSPDGRTLAVDPADGKTVRLWDVAAHRERASLRGAAAWAFFPDLAYSPDGTLLATCAEKTIRLWDVGTGRQVATLTGPTTLAALSIRFSPDGKTLASGGCDNRVRLWDVAARREIVALEGHLAWVQSLAFSPDGKTLASASSDSTVRLWDLASPSRPARILRGHVASVNSLAFSPDGKFLATGGGEGTMRLWDAATKETTALLRGHTTIVTALAFAPDGRSLVSGDRDGLVKVWDVAAAPDPNVLAGPRTFLTSLAVSPDGKTLAVSDADDHDRTVKLWDLASRRLIGVLRGHQRFVFCATFSPDGRTVATGSGESTVRLWDVATRRELRAFGADEQIGWVAFSPDGQLLAAGGHGVRVWDVATGREVAHPDTWSQQPTGVRVRFSPDGTLLAVCSGGTVGLWDVATWRKAGSLGGPGAEVLGLAFSPDGRDLAACDTGGTLWLWDLAGKRVIASNKAHTPVTPPSLAGCVAFSPDGRRLATSGGDSVVKLWDVGRFQEVAALTGHDGPIYGLAFTPDGNTLASAGGDTTRLWHAPPLDEGPREPDGLPVLPPLETFRFFTLQVLGTAQGTLTAEADAHRIDVTAVDGTDWHVQLQQSFDDIEEGATYTVRFRARADAPSSLLLAAHIGESNWRNIGLLEKVPLSEGWRTYQYEFRAKDIAASNWIVFNVGGRTGTLWIVDLALTRAAR